MFPPLFECFLCPWSEQSPSQYLSVAAQHSLFSSIIFSEAWQPCAKNINFRKIIHKYLIILTKLCRVQKKHQNFLQGQFFTYNSPHCTRSNNEASHVIPPLSHTTPSQCTPSHLHVSELYSSQTYHETTDPSSKLALIENNPSPAHNHGALTFLDSEAVYNFQYILEQGNSKKYEERNKLN